MDINESFIKENLSMTQCIKLMEEAFLFLSSNPSKDILRSAIPIEGNNLLGIMPTTLPSKKIAGIKVLTIMPSNYKINLPSHQGKILVFETDTGFLKGSVDANEVTAIRTAAASAVATKYLSKKDSKILTLFGAGTQARKHLESLLLVRDIKRVHIWSIHYAEVLEFKREMEKRFSIEIIAFKDPREATLDADIICTLTFAKEPILFGEWIKEGAHINAIGACRPNHRELDSVLASKGLFFSDSDLSFRNEAGDFLIPLGEGTINWDRYRGMIGSLLSKEINRRRDNKEITIFKGLGNAVEDVIVANYLLEKYNL